MTPQYIKIYLIDSNNPSRELRYSDTMDRSQYMRINPCHLGHNNKQSVKQTTGLVFTSGETIHPESPFISDVKGQSETAHWWD